MKKIAVFIALIFIFTSIPHISNAQIVSGFSTIQELAIPGNDFIGSISLSEANFYETDFNSKYLFPMQGICGIGNGKIAVIDNSYGRIHILNSVLENELTFGSLKEFTYPTDIAFYGGNFYVTDPLRDNITVFSKNGQFVKSFGNAIFTSPIGIAVSKDGIYVSDYFKETLYKLDTKYAIKKTVKIDYPGGLTEKDGRIYAVSMSGRSVYVYDKNLNLLKTIINSNLHFPSDVDVDNSGNIYVVDRGLIKGGDSIGRVLKFSPEGKFLFTIGTPAKSYPNQKDGALLTPCGIALQDGNIFVMDGGYYYWDSKSEAPFGSPIGERLTVFSDTSIFLSKKDFPQQTQDRLVNPLSATLDKNGNIWAVNYGGMENSELVEFSPSGEFVKRIKKVGSINLSSIYCVYSDKKGHILVGGDGIIVVLNNLGKLESLLDGLNSGKIRKIIKGNDGYFYATLFQKNSILKFSINGKTKNIIPVCNFPSGICEGKNNHFYITSVDDNKVHIYNDTFKEIGTIGTGGGRGKMNFYVPEDVATDEYGNIIVADTENGRLSVFNNDGTLVYQSPRIFYEISSLEVEDGTLVVSDCFHNIIRVLKENTTEKQYLFFASVYPDSQLVSPGGETDFSLNIVNAGTKSDSYNIFIEKNISPNWTIILGKNSISLNPNAKVTIPISVKAPNNAADGDSITLNITISSPHNKKILGANITVSTKLPPTLHVKSDNVMIGKEIAVPIYVNGLKNVTGIAFTMYVPEGLNFESIQNGGLINNGLILSKTNKNRVMFAVAMKGGQTISGSGIAAIAKFTGNNISENMIEFTDAYCENPVGGKFNFDIKTEKIAVTPYLFINFSNGIESPDQNFIFTGKTTVNTKVTVNGQTVKVNSNGTFTATVILNSQKNTITVTAQSKNGEKTVIQRTVFYHGKQLITIKLQIGNPIMTVNGVKMEIDPGRETKPFIVNGWNRTVVPIRAIIEAIGGDIGWEPDDRMVWIIVDTTTINMWINNPQAKINATTVWIDTSNHTVSPIIVNDRTFIPVRFAAESLGCNVQWDGETRTVTITYER